MISNLKEEEHHFEFLYKGPTQPKIGCMQRVVKRAEAGNENKVLGDGMLFFGVPYTG